MAVTTTYGTTTTELSTSFWTASNPTTSAFTASTTTPESPRGCDSVNDPTCGLQRFLLGVVCFIICLALVLCITRILFIYCSMKRRRQRPSVPETYQPRSPRAEIEEIGHPFSYIADAGFDNCGFMDPPPRYDQLFKRDDPPPTYVDGLLRSAELTAVPPSPQEITAAPQNLIVQPTLEEPRGETSQADLQSSNEPNRGVVSSGNNSTNSSMRSIVPSEHLPSSSGVLPTGAFGTSVPPHVLAASIQDSEDHFRSRAFTEESTNTLVTGNGEPRPVTNGVTIPSETANVPSGSPYFSVTEQPVIENLI